jgi:arginyl-tRNA synthetase
MKARIVKSLQKATGIKEAHLEFPENEAHGDYATNVALVSAKKKKKKPKELAEEIIKKLQKDKDLTKVVSKIEVAGPGFINFFLSQDFLFTETDKIIKEGEEYGSSNLGKGKTVLVEYSSPNIAKYFGIGHLKSTIIGQTLYNLYKFLGYKVIGENHLGDWGTQFGMIIAQVKRKNLNIDDLTIDDFEKLYVGFNKETEDKPELREEAKHWFKKLEKGDKEARQIWQKAKDVSLTEFKRIYELLGVTIENTHGESFYEDKMLAIIKEAKEKGLSKKSEGAEIVELKGMPPGMLVKSDGATTYFTRDLAAVKYRIKTWDPELLIYEVGADQKLHFRQLFEAARLLGWAKNREFVHIAHGLIRGKLGKMSTRRGETVRLEGVLEEAIKRARKIIDKSETGRELSEKEKKNIAKAVGVGAIKYFDLSHHPTSDIIFDWEKLFLLEGNSAPYLQYTFARTQSVLEKAKAQDTKYDKQDINDEETLLLRSFPRFSETIIDAAKNYSPNLLANYLFDLAQKYNNFYNQHRIIGSENQGLRIMLTVAVGQILKNGLTLLGIKTPERM